VCKLIKKEHCLINLLVGQE